MKAVIKKVDFLEEKDGKYGAEFSFRISYDDKSAYYVAKKREQDKFIAGTECEFTEEERTSKAGNKYYIVKPIYQKGGFSNFTRAVKKEQSKYSGFGDSYIKDMLVGGILLPENTEKDVEHNDIVMATWKARAFEIFEHMVELDKSLEK